VRESKKNKGGGVFFLLVTLSPTHLTIKHTYLAKQQWSVFICKAIKAQKKRSVPTHKEEENVTA
jgi:hypothetical protein